MIKDLEEALEENIVKLFEAFYKNPAIFLSEADVQCYLYGLLINDERIKKFSPLIKKGDKLGKDELNKDSMTLLVHAEKPRGTVFPKYDIAFWCFENTNFKSLKPVIGIEIKFNKGPYKANRNTSPVKSDLDKLIKDEKLKRKYLLWLNWGRRMNDQGREYVDKIEEEANENVRFYYLDISSGKPETNLSKLQNYWSHKIEKLHHKHSS